MMPRPVTDSPGRLPPDVRQYLLEHARARRRVALRGEAAAAGTLGLAWVLTWCMVDRIAQLSGGVRGVLLGLALAGMVARLYRPLRRVLQRPVDLNNATADIERLCPEFEGKLATVCSRLLGEAGQQGSPQMLAALLEQVRQQIAHLPPRPLINARKLRRRVTRLAIVAAVICLLAMIPDVELPRLMGRLAAPWADIPPVVTTRLTVTAPTGAALNVRQGESVQVRVEARRLGEDALLLQQSVDGRTWTTKVMERVADTVFAGDIGPVDKDEWFRVSAGNVQTPATPVRVLRKPAITAFRMRYEYPAYMARNTLTAQNSDGMVEAPAGTKVTLSITTTEPLETATLRVGGKHVPMQATMEPTVYQAALQVLRDERYRIELMSRRGLAGSSPESCIIRTVPTPTTMVTSLSTSRETKLPAKEDQEASTPASQDDLAGYRQMLQVYFDVLRKSAHHGDKP